MVTDYTHLSDWCDTAFKTEAWTNIKDQIDLQEKLSDILRGISKQRAEGVKRASKGAEEGIKKFFGKILDETIPKNISAWESIENIRVKRKIAEEEAVGFRIDISDVERTVRIDSFIEILKDIREARTIEEYNKIEKRIRDIPFREHPKNRLLLFIREKRNEIIKRRRELTEREKLIEIEERIAEMNLRQLKQIPRKLEKIEISKEKEEEISQKAEERLRFLRDTYKTLQQAVKEAKNIDELKQIERRIIESELGRINKEALREQTAIKKEMINE